MAVDVSIAKKGGICLRLVEGEMVGRMKHLGGMFGFIVVRHDGAPHEAGLSNYEFDALVPLFEGDGRGPYVGLVEVTDRGGGFQRPLPVVSNELKHHVEGIDIPVETHVGD